MDQDLLAIEMQPFYKTDWQRQDNYQLEIQLENKSDCQITPQLRLKTLSGDLDLDNFSWQLLGNNGLLVSESLNEALQKGSLELDQLQPHQLETYQVVFFNHQILTDDQQLHEWQFEIEVAVEAACPSSEATNSDQSSIISSPIIHQTTLNYWAEINNHEATTTASIRMTELPKIANLELIPLPNTQTLLDADSSDSSFLCWSGLIDNQIEPPAFGSWWLLILICLAWVLTAWCWWRREARFRTSLKEVAPDHRSMAPVGRHPEEQGDWSAIPRPIEVLS